GTKHIEPQLEKSKDAPLEIQILSSSASLDEDLIQLLVDHAHRWSTVVFYAYFEQFVARLGPSPLVLDTLEIRFTTISHDCKLFSLIRSSLRRLSLNTVSIPQTFDPTLGLEELYLYDVSELLEDGTIGGDLSVSKFYQFLRANPNLRILQHEGGSYPAANDRGLQTVNLPKLKDVTIFSSQILHLFRAEQCIQVSFTVHTVSEKPPPSAWTTFVHALKRVERFLIHVGDGSLSVTAVAGPCTVDLFLDNIDAEDGDSGILAYSLLEDILDEAERDTPILAGVELSLRAPNLSRGNFDVNLEVLKLIQTPVLDPSSGQTRWRIPNLDTISMFDQGLSYHRLQAFVQARSNHCCTQPASPITGIFTRSMPFFDHQENVLDKVMAYTTSDDDVYIKGGR
ncbi:hypothetical protein FRC00_007504, partial [Tulasnella sp. 408]